MTEAQLRAICQARVDRARKTAQTARLDSNVRKEAMAVGEAKAYQSILDMLDFGKH
jgi:hypothetical protein